MDEPENEDELATLSTVETEVHQLMGLFDAPAFARRGQDMEHGLKRLHNHCRRVRLEMLDMVHIRLRQWASAATGPDDWASTFAEPIEPLSLWSIAGAEAPQWANQPARPRRRIAIARDLIASIARFNRRWTRCVEGLKIEPINRLIDQYNRYYVLEKECVLGSHRLAVRAFEPEEPITIDLLLKQHPLLPLPELRR